jgi:hypothetical protein
MLSRVTFPKVLGLVILTYRHQSLTSGVVTTVIILLKLSRSLVPTSRRNQAMWK